MNKKLLPLAAMEKVIKQADSEIRVSEKAKSALKDELEKYGLEIAERAWKLARHAGRTTVKSKDIILATEEMNKK